MCIYNWFYIVGKSGPLFNFDVNEDVRIKSDASVEKNESHAGQDIKYLDVLCISAMWFRSL